ncbi:hypothetical protein DKM44_14595 [Deinococcus irradiatisoli]|uniref:Integrase n=2 Tax=Deinococcus irradiatisoli TaxID=2202254 RepID=A0A2Z3JH25_9DEIO|nr:hypothetical protein DKM44_14595 [Deinococcus irradiatisoli]
MEQLWDEFLYYLRVERRSKATLSFYSVTRTKLERYLDSLGGVHEASGVSVSHLRGFVLWLGEQGLNGGGQHAHVRAVRALFNWGQREELLSANPARRLALPSLPSQRLLTVTSEVTQRLLGAARTTDQPLRDAAMVMTLFDTGLRASELVKVTVADLEVARGLIRVRGGKGGKDRTVPIGSRALTALATYQRRER